MKSAPGTRARLGYHDHYVVDGGKARIILAALVTPGSVVENAPMLDPVRRVRFRPDGRASARAFVSLPDFRQRGSYAY